MDKKSTYCMNDKTGGVSTTVSFVLKIVEIFREDRRKTPSQYGIFTPMGDYRANLENFVSTPKILEKFYGKKPADMYGSRIPRMLKITGLRIFSVKRSSTCLLLVNGYRTLLQ